MDDKTVEALFMQIKTEETPDLWEQIEKSLPEKDACLSGRYGQNPDPSDRKGKRKGRMPLKFKKYIAVGAAAAACLLVVSIPVKLLLGAGMKSETSSEAYDMASSRFSGGTGAGLENKMAAEEAGIYDAASADMYDGGAYDAAEAGEPQEAAGGTAQADMEMAQQEADGEMAQPSEENSGSERKLIRTVSLDMETLAFDDTAESLKAAVSACGGYFESSDVYGSSSYENDLKYGSYTVRIPQDRLDSFLENLGDAGHVLSKNETTEDITLQYVDTESHITALKTQQEKLMALMDKAESMEDVLKIESALTEVRYELEYYESTKKQYDNKVSYSTVRISIQEVRERTPDIEPGIGTRIKDGFMNAMENMGEGFVDIFVWIITCIPYFLTIAVVAAVIIVIIKKIRKRNIR